MESDVPSVREFAGKNIGGSIRIQPSIFLANHTTWTDSWGETFEVIRKKVLSDAPTHGYITTNSDILSNWAGYDWYKTGLNPVYTVSSI